MGSKVGAASGKASRRVQGGKLLNMKRSALIETSRLLRAVVLIGLQQEQYRLGRVFTRALNMFTTCLSLDMFKNNRVFTSVKPV